MTRRVKDHLDAPAREEWVVADEESVGALAPKRCEGSVEFAASASVEGLDL